MNLTELKKGESAIVKKLSSKPELKQRFASFGLIKGAEVELIDCSPAKANLEIMVDTTLLVLRREEALTIEIERVNNGV